jgi:hypothetical protein
MEICGVMLWVGLDGFDLLWEWTAFAALREQGPPFIFDSVLDLGYATLNVARYGTFCEMGNFIGGEYI